MDGGYSNTALFQSKVSGSNAYSLAPTFFPFLSRRKVYILQCIMVYCGVLIAPREVEKMEKYVWEKKVVTNLVKAERTRYLETNREIYESIAKQIEKVEEIMSLVNISREAKVFDRVVRAEYYSKSMDSGEIYRVVFEDGTLYVYVNAHENGEYSTEATDREQKRVAKMPTDRILHNFLKTLVEEKVKQREILDSLSVYILKEVE